MPTILRRHPYRIVVTLAIVMAFISARLLFHGSVLNIIPWGILAVGCGGVASAKKSAWKLGASFGFVLSFCFLWFDKTGHTSLHEFLPLLVIIPLPSLFGALCGAVLCQLGYGLWPRKTAK